MLSDCEASTETIRVCNAPAYGPLQINQAEYSLLAEQEIEGGEGDCLEVDMVTGALTVHEPKVQLGLASSQPAACRVMPLKHPSGT